MIIVYTGNGKGKTTAAFGLALRSLGQGKKVAIIQFMKSGLSGEIMALTLKKPFSDQLEVRMFGGKNFVEPKNPSENDKRSARAGLRAVKSVLKKEFDVIILDEINLIIGFGLLELEEVLKVIKSVPRKKHLVLTGRRAHLKILELADIVTEMRKVKHCYDFGAKAKKGIEY